MERNEESLKMGMTLKKILAHVFLRKEFTLEGQRVMTIREGRTVIKVIAETKEKVYEATYNPNKRLSTEWIGRPLYF